MNKTSLWAVLALTSIISFHARAADPSAAPNAETRPEMRDDDGAKGWEHRRMPFYVTFSARYYSLNNSGYSNAFTSSGLSAPKSGAVGMDFSVYLETKSLWQIGFGFGGASTGNSNGANNGSYDSNIYGLWLGKKFELSDDNSLTIGGLLAYGSTTMQVITTGISGNTDETCFTVEPKIIATHQITPWLGLGLSVSYLEPMAQNQDIKGNNLTSGNISLHSLSGGVELVIGRSGHSK
jgi:hypothetical protein